MTVAKIIQIFQILIRLSNVAVVFYHGQNDLQEVFISSLKREFPGFCFFDVDDDRNSLYIAAAQKLSSMTILDFSQEPYVYPDSIASSLSNTRSGNIYKIDDIDCSSIDQDNIPATKNDLHILKQFCWLNRNENSFKFYGHSKDENLVYDNQTESKCGLIGLKHQSFNIEEFVETQRRVHNNLICLSKCRGRRYRDEKSENILVRECKLCSSCKPCGYKEIRGLCPGDGCKNDTELSKLEEKRKKYDLLSDRLIRGLFLLSSIIVGFFWLQVVGITSKRYVHTNIQIACLFLKCAWSCVSLELGKGYIELLCFLETPICHILAVSIALDRAYIDLVSCRDLNQFESATMWLNYWLVIPFTTLQIYNIQQERDRRKREFNSLFTHYRLDLIKIQSFLALIWAVFILSKYRGEPREIRSKAFKLLLTIIILFNSLYFCVYIIYEDDNSNTFGLLVLIVSLVANCYQQVRHTTDESVTVPGETNQSPAWKIPSTKQFHYNFYLVKLQHQDDYQDKIMYP